MPQVIKLCVIGVCAGAVNGLFGAGSGLILVPLLSHFTSLKESEVFPSSIVIAFSLSFVSLAILSLFSPLPCKEAFPYLLGSVGGGVLAGTLGSRIPVVWLHRILGILILWGGIRYIW